MEADVWVKGLLLVGSHTGLCWGDAMAPSSCCTHREQCPGPGTSPPALVLERIVYWNAFTGYSPVCSFMFCKVGRSGFAGTVGSLFILLVPPKWAWDGFD